LYSGFQLGCGMTSAGTSTECINAVMDALRTLTIYFEKPKQVSLNRADLGLGADYWIFFSTDNFTSSRLDNRQRLYQRNLPCDLCVRYKTDAESYPKLNKVIDDLDVFLRTPRVIKNLNINAVRMLANAPLRQDTPDNPQFLVKPLVINIEQIVNT